MSMNRKSGQINSSMPNFIIYSRPFHQMYYACDVRKGCSGSSVTAATRAIARDLNFSRLEFEMSVLLLAPIRSAIVNVP